MRQILLFCALSFAVSAQDVKFETQERILVFPAALLAQIGTLRDTFGDSLPACPKAPIARRAGKVALLGFKDREDSVDLRAGELGVDVIPVTLADGRKAINGHWSRRAVAKWQLDTAAKTGPLKDVVEITPKELQLLLPPPIP